MKKRRECGFSQTRVNNLCKLWCDKHLDPSDTSSVIAWHSTRRAQTHTSVPCSACHSSCEVCISLSPTAEPPRLDPWWRTRRSPPARRSPPDTLLSAAAPGWSATAGSVWTQGSTQACRPSPGRRTLNRGEQEREEDEVRACHLSRCLPRGIAVWMTDEWWRWGMMCLISQHVPWAMLVCANAL